VDVSSFKLGARLLSIDLHLSLGADTWVATCMLIKSELESADLSAAFDVARVVHAYPARRNLGFLAAPPHPRADLIESPLPTSRIFKNRPATWVEIEAYS
jgi:hypothetical protein